MKRSAKDRLRRSLGKLAEWCRKHRHWKVGDQHLRLVSRVRGHYRYFGVTNNGGSLKMFLREAAKTWRRWLDRRTRPGTQADQFVHLPDRLRRAPPGTIAVLFRFQVGFEAGADGAGAAASLKPPPAKGILTPMRPSATAPFFVACLALVASGVFAQAGQGVPVGNISFGGSEFVREFNSAAGSPRLVMVFSPTCGRCIHGAYDVWQILKELPDAGLKVFVLWSPILSGDTKLAASKAAGYLPDPRAVHFWDVWKFGLNHYTSSLAYPEGKQAWDIFVLYAPGGQWSETSQPEPAAWLQDHKLDIGVQYSKEALAGRLRELIGTASKAGASR